jgi:hypothetical protein
MLYLPAVWLGRDTAMITQAGKVTLTIFVLAVICAYMFTLWMTAWTYCIRKLKWVYAFAIAVGAGWLRLWLPVSIAFVIARPFRLYGNTGQPMLAELTVAGMGYIRLVEVCSPTSKALILSHDAPLLSHFLLPLMQTVD